MLRPETVFLFLLAENPHTHTKMASIPFWPPTYQSQAYIEHEACFSLLFHDVNGVRSNIMTTQEDYGAFIHRDWFKSKAHKRQDVCVCVSCERKLNAFSCYFYCLYWVESWLLVRGLWHWVGCNHRRFLLSNQRTNLRSNNISNFMNFGWKSNTSFNVIRGKYLGDKSPIFGMRTQ